MAIRMNSEEERPRSLRDMELAVEAEGRQWVHRRLEAVLQAEANRHSGVLPSGPTQSPPAAVGKHAPAHGFWSGGIEGLAWKGSR